MKQRNLTTIQLRLIEMERQGFGDGEIAHELGIHERTVRAKRTAIKKGLVKGAYANFPDDSRQPLLFED